MATVVLLAIARPAAAAAAAATPATSASTTAPTTAVAPAGRTALAARQLQAGSLAQPVDLAAFGPPAAAAPPSHRFPGRLVLRTDGGEAHFEERHVDPAQREPLNEQRRRLPPFDRTFVQDGATLIPVERGVVVAGHPEWDLVVEPGRAWDEPGDGGWTRAAIPFALQEANANCTHNGVLTFLYRGDGRISRVAYEIASETCAYYKFDAWGLVPAELRRHADPRATAIVEAHRRHERARLPVRPLAALAREYPGVDPARLALAAPQDGDPPTRYGLVVRGIHYASACATRHGEHPFCDTLALPSYSTAKSIFAAVGLMRLERLRPGARHERVAAHVPTCGRNAAWRDVTLGHALDMTTGVFGSASAMADERAPYIETFFLAPNHLARITYACTLYPRQAEPGTTFTYHTPDTYVLGTAMRHLFAGMQGRDVDLYAELIAEPLWDRLALSPTIRTTRVTYDAVAQPWMGWGLTYHADDIVRIAAWLDAGAPLDGAAALDPGMLAAALQRDPQRPGLAAGRADLRYQGGFWARDLQAVLGCGRPTWIPYMSGYGGISVVLLPGGIQYYYFGDGGIADWAPAAVEASRIASACR